MRLLTVSYLLNVTDYFFTAFWVHLYGIEAEANPLGQWFIENRIAGFVKIVVMAGLFCLLGALIKRCPRAKYATGIVFGTYCIVTACHIMVAVSVL